MVFKKTAIVYEGYQEVYVATFYEHTPDDERFMHETSYLNRVFLDFSVDLSSKMSRHDLRYF